MNDINVYTDSFFTELRNTVRSRVDEKRFDHILSVENKAVELAELYSPEKADKIRIAAILHDITKAYSSEEQLSICRKFGYPADSISPPVLHSVTAPLVIQNELSNRFPVLNDPEILCAVRWHSTGHNNMTLSETLIYLADYIEDTRQYKVCIDLRHYFESGLQVSDLDKCLHLYKTMVISFGYTIFDLISKNKAIDPNTIEAWNYFQNLIDLREKGSS